MSWAPGTNGTMKRRRKVAAIVMLAAMLVVTEKGNAAAQDAPPDLRMLMNLDLFEPRHNGGNYAAAPAASPSDDSMFEQIRTLDQMGYLGNHREADGNGTPAPRAAGEMPAAAPPPPESAGAPPESPMPASHPSNDVEGPEQ
jgi:hypothetical protein